MEINFYSFKVTVFFFIRFYLFHVMRGFFICRHVFVCCFPWLKLDVALKAYFFVPTTSGVIQHFRLRDGSTLDVAVNRHLSSRQNVSSRPLNDGRILSRPRDKKDNVSVYSYDLVGDTVRRFRLYLMGSTSSRGSRRPCQIFLTPSHFVNSAARKTGVHGARATLHNTK